MKRIILDIDDRYAHILTVSLVGSSISWETSHCDTYVTTSAFNLDEGDHFAYVNKTIGRKNGKFMQKENEP